MGRQVIQDDDLACLQRRRQHLVQIRFKGEGIHRSFNGPGRLQALDGKRGKQRRILAAIARRLPIGALPSGCPPIERRQPHMGAALIDKNKLTGIQVTHILPPGGACRLVALAGRKRLFLCVQRSRRSERGMVATLTC